MDETLDTRRVLIYLAFAFGIAWATSLVVHLTGGLRDSPIVIPQANVSLALILVAGPVMWAPALAHLLTRLLTGEGWEDVYLRPRLKGNWPYYVTAWLLPGLLTVAGMIIFFLFFPRYYDPELTTLKQMMAQNGVDVESASISVWGVVAVQIFQAMLLAPLFNGIATLGEEFGWRGYLQRKLMGLGGRKAMLLMGLIWGVWHWPVILMGHNYGLGYPGAPFLGPLAMVWFTLSLGTFLGWVTLKAQSVWPAVIGHAAVNGMANLGTVFVQGEPNPLLGPLPVGLLGGLGFTVVAWVLFLVPGALRSSKVSGGAGR
jgi:membrane protease YdiL (CAAX protease family)